MNKKGGSSPLMIFLVILVIGVLGTSIYFGTRQSVDNKSDGTLGADLGSCPTDGQTTLTLSLQNGLNVTGSEQFDASVVMVGSNGDYKTGSDTTSGSYTLNCGEEYTLSVLSADGDGADNSQLESVLIGSNVKVAEGKAVFTASKDSMTIILKATQHGVLEFKAYDETARANACNSDNSCADYETDGVSFESSVNATALAVGASGSLDYTINARSTAVDTDFTDAYTLIAVEAPVTTWETPSIKVDGKTLTNVKGSLTAQEEKQFSSYEYIYKIDNAILDGNDGIDVRVYLQALAGVDPSTDPEVDFATAGNYLSVDGTTVKLGSAKDDSSSTVVYTIQDVTLNIS